MNDIWTFIKCIPELLALIRALEAAAQQAETKRKVADDIKTIHTAFSDKDPKKLNALFNSN